MHRQPRCITPSRTRYATGEQRRGSITIPRARSASPNGPAPSQTSSLSACDSATWTASGSRSRRGKVGAASYKQAPAGGGGGGGGPRRGGRVKGRGHLRIALAESRAYT